MQIQLSSHSFRIFYGSTFGGYVASVINAIGEYEINFGLQWYEDFAIIALDRLSRETWKDILEILFRDLCDLDEEE